MKLIVDPPRWLETRSRPPSMEPDLVSVVEAAYELDKDDRSWIEGLVRATGPLLDQGLGVVGYFWHVEDSGALLRIEHETLLDCPSGLPEALSQAARLLPEKHMWRFQVAGPCHSHSEARGLGPSYVESAEIRDALLPLAGARDMVNVRATVADMTSGIAIGACTHDLTTIAPRTRAAFERVAVHISAAARLRSKTLSQVERKPTRDGAVFDSAGKLLHAEGTASSTSARGALAAGVEQVMASRGRLRKEDSARALELWKALVSGRWSIVDHADTDGKRLILARRNQTTVSEPAALTPNERLVALYSSSGHSNKLMSYELGLAPSTISTLLRSALRKLRVRSRSELMRLFSPPGAE